MSDDEILKLFSTSHINWAPDSFWIGIPILGVNINFGRFKRREYKISKPLFCENNLIFLSFTKF